jgi:hypothetical protein
MIRVERVTPNPAALLVEDMGIFGKIVVSALR